MKKRHLLFTMLALSLGCFTGGSGVMAQSAGWDAIYNQTQTSSTNWTKLDAGSTSGRTLGSGSATTYYYIDRNLDFTNTNGSGLTITGTVYLYVPAGYTLFCQGSNANGRIGAGAGIELPSGNTLYIFGGGSVTAKGGNAANGSNGGNGTYAEGNDGDWTRTGTGGTGGDGGGGAGAGIGTRGGDGGIGGSGGAGYRYDDGEQDDEQNGTDGSNGTNGSSAGAMGTLYVTNGITVTATGGDAGSSGGSGGDRGRGYVYDGYSYNVTVAGGGGGGGGGFGGAASDTGKGGPGGGGGGGGAGGSQDWRSNSDGGVYNVYAQGGSGGTNANGNNAGNGAHADCKSWHIVEDGSFDDDDWNAASGSARIGLGGSGGGTGSASYAGTQNVGNLTYNITYIPVKTKVNGSNLDAVTVQYVAGSANVILPANAAGYQWVLSTYGKSCAPQGVSANEFATATKAYYGGSTDDSYDESDRTILLANVYGDLVFQEVATLCKLANSGSNAQTLIEFADDGYPVTVRLQNRTLYKDNEWNTLCLPFAMSEAQIAASPLAGAVIYKMDTETTKYYPSGYETYNYPVLYFKFVSTTSMEAGKPYLVKWTEIDDFTTDGNLVDNTKKGGTRHELDFESVTVTTSTAGSWAGNNITFQGTLSSSGNLSANDKTKLVLGQNSTLYYPKEDMNIGACHGYFVIPQSVASQLPDNPANAPQFVMSFNDGMTTSINKIDGSGVKVQGADTYFNLNGQRLSAPQKGINIVNGKKVIIK